MVIGKLVFGVLILMPAAASASIPECERISVQVAALKSTLIEESDAPIVSSAVLDGTESALTDAMVALNDSGATDDSCPVSELSGRIVQTLQAVSSLRDRNTRFMREGAE